MRRLMRAGELRENKVPVNKPEFSTGHPIAKVNSIGVMQPPPYSRKLHKR